MTIHHLQVFLAVYAELSITKAAKKLFISQPAVSKYIHEIELYYGNKLFVRSTRSLTATSFGQDLYHYASQIILLYNEMNISLSPTNWHEKTLRVGAATSIGELYMPQLIRHYTELHPDITISVTVGDTSLLTNKLMDNSLDFFISEKYLDSPLITHMVIHQGRLVAICNHNNPLARQEVVTAADMVAYPLLLGKVTLPIIESYFDQHLVHATCKWESSSVPALINAVKNDIGISFQSHCHVLAINDPDIAILNVPDLTITRNIYLQYQKKQLLSPLVQDFIECFRRYIDDPSHINPDTQVSLSGNRCPEMP